MAVKNTLLNYTTGETTSIIDERYRLALTAGSPSFILGDVKRCFIETDFTIEESDSGGTVLTEDVDYEFSEKDSYYTGEEGENCWTKVKILNAAYYDSVIYVTYKALHSYVDADTINTLIAAVAAATNPIGAILPYAGSAAPTGHLICDGSAISRTTYADLFAIISTDWGVGDGSTTFNIPDLRGAFLRGTGSHGSENMADGNDFAGPALGAYENDQAQSWQIGADNDSTGARDTWGRAVIRGQRITVTGDAAFTEFQLNTGYQGGANMIKAMDDGTNGAPRTGDESRPFNAGVNYIIKT